MGFRPEPTIYNLSFKGTALDGLHVRMSCCTVAEYNEMIGAAISVGDEVSESVVKSNESVLNMFANHLLSWDLEDMAGQQVPCTREGVDSQERPLIAQIVTAWQVAMVNIPNPSNTDSNDGKISEEQSLGLGNASQSLGS